MNASHHRRADPGAPHNHKPTLIAKAQPRKFSVLRRAPQLYGDPEHAVAADGESVAQVLALFFSEDDARAYAAWRNLTRERNPLTARTSGA